MLFSASKKTPLLGLGSIIGVGLVSLILYEIFFWLTHVYEYNAKVTANLTTISSPIDGEIEKIFVKEGDQVKKGAVLVSLNNKLQKLKVDAIKADLEREIEKRRKSESIETSFLAALNSKILTKKEIIKSLEVRHQTVRERYNIEKSNFIRTKKLFSKNLLSKKHLEEERRKQLVAKSELEKSASGIKVARLEMREIETSRLKLKTLKNEQNIHSANIKKLEILVQKEQEMLNYYSVRSPINGIVDGIFINKGEKVELADRIILLHDEGFLWVESNVDESQLRHIKIGQSVIVNFNAYPYEEFKGIVTFIGSITEAQMSDKLSSSRSHARQHIQRIPIRVRLLNPPEKIAPGMTADINIKIYD